MAQSHIQIKYLKGKKTSQCRILEFAARQEMLMLRNRPNYFWRPSPLPRACFLLSPPLSPPSFVNPLSVSAPVGTGKIESDTQIVLREIVTVLSRFLQLTPSLCRRHFDFGLFCLSDLVVLPVVHLNIFLMMRFAFSLFPPVKKPRVQKRTDLWLGRV